VTPRWVNDLQVERDDLSLLLVHFAFVTPFYCTNKWNKNKEWILWSVRLGWREKSEWNVRSDVHEWKLPILKTVSIDRIHFSTILNFSFHC
jgi:hypothetical protein